MSEQPEENLDRSVVLKQDNSEAVPAVLAADTLLDADLEAEHDTSVTFVDHTEADSEIVTVLDMAVNIADTEQVDTFVEVHELAETCAEVVMGRDRKKVQKDKQRHKMIE